MSRVRTLNIALFSLLFEAAQATQAASNCSAPAENSKAYLHATEAVRQLPEVRAWSAGHSLPIVFGAPVDKELSIKGDCYWSVTVYAARPERIELWNVFFVSRARNQVAFVQQQSTGEPIPITTWRARIGR